MVRALFSNENRGHVVICQPVASHQGLTKFKASESVLNDSTPGDTFGTFM
jgi:hypothetical protein